MENVQIALEKEVLKVSFQQQNFKRQWEQWNLKLRQLTCLYQGKPEVFFHFPALDMNTIVLCISDMKDICNVCGYTNQMDHSAGFRIIHTKLRGGQLIEFERGGLIVGNVEKDVMIQLKEGDLYVMGTIKGQIECLNEKSRIICQKMEQARICFQGKWQISTKNEGMVYYDKIMHLEDRG